MVALFTTLFSVIVGVMVLWALTLKPQLDKITEDAANAVAAKQKIDGIDAQTADVSGQLPAVQQKVKFVKDLQEYNLAYVKLYRNIARYTSPSILYTSLNVTGTSLSISAYAPNMPSLLRYMQIMYNEPDIKSLTISAIPGYQAAYTPSTKDYSIPALPPGFVARFPGSAIPVRSFTVVNGQVTKISGIEDFASQPRYPKIYQPNLGFDFSVTATLRGQITAPALPTVAGAAPPNPNGPGGPGDFGPNGPGGPGGPGGPPR